MGEQDPPAQPSTFWQDGLELSRSRPSPKPDIEVADSASTFSFTASELAKAQDERHAGAVSRAWPGETSKPALEAMRGMKMTMKTLAYASGATNDALTWASGLVQQYQLDFNDRVGPADWGVGDDIADDHMDSYSRRQTNWRDRYAKELSLYAPEDVFGDGAHVSSTREMG